MYNLRDYPFKKYDFTSFVNSFKSYTVSMNINTIKKHHAKQIFNR